MCSALNLNADTGALPISAVIEHNVIHNLMCVCIGNSEILEDKFFYNQNGLPLPRLFFVFIEGIHYKYDVAYSIVSYTLLCFIKNPYISWNRTWLINAM